MPDTRINDDGWEEVLTSSGWQPLLYRYWPDGTYTTNAPYYMTWAKGRLFIDEPRDYCIKYTNKTKQQLCITDVGIRTVSGCSDGKTFYAYEGGYIGPTEGTYGAGGRYQILVNVQQKDKSKYRMVYGTPKEDADTADGKVMKIPRCTYNMDTLGDPSHTATFGNGTGDYTQTKYNMLKHRRFYFPECPVILPGRCAYIHFRVKSLDLRDGETGSQAVIRFIMNPGDMEIPIGPVPNEDSPYVWRYQKGEDGKLDWHLVEPIYIGNGNKWGEAKK